MIEYVHVQLSIWGRWERTRTSAGLGYSKVSPMFRDARHGGSYASQPPAGVSIDAAQEVHDTAAAVARLGLEHRRLAIEYYVIGGTAVQVAGRVGCGRQRLYERLTALQASVLGHINDVVAGVPAAKVVDIGRTLSV